MSKNRNYNDKDVDMLMASKIIANSFSSFIAELSVVRSNWSGRYASGLISRIDNALENYLGIDPKKNLREATATLQSLQTPAKRDLAFFKTQIDEDFKKDVAKRDAILKNLGFTAYLRDVQKGNQESLIQLLFKFKTNMGEELKAEIVAKGTNPALIEAIIGYAISFSNANVVQETAKGSSKEVTKEAADAFNAIYDDIIALCKIASNYYKDEPLKKELFTFSKVISNLGAPSAKEGEASAGPVK
jgi:hypothetical protein